MLRRLSGRRHDVLTGVSLRKGAFEIGRVETTAVHFAPLGDAEIAWYVASGEGRDKAGAYAVQGLASRFIRRIEGSYANVVGLPVTAVRGVRVGGLAMRKWDSGADNPAALTFTEKADSCWHRILHLVHQRTILTVVFSWKSL